MDTLTLPQDFDEDKFYAAMIDKVAKRRAGQLKRNSLVGQPLILADNAQAVVDLRMQKTLIGRAGSANARSRYRHNNGTLTPGDILSLFNEQSGRCFYCDSPLDCDFILDHKYPLSRGGDNTPNNVCCTCYHCNSSKGASTISEWMARC